MGKTTCPLTLPTSVKNAAAELARSDRVSLNQFIAAALAEMVDSIRTAEQFLKERSRGAKPRDLLKFLRKAPNLAPAEDDR